MRATLSLIRRFALPGALIVALVVSASPIFAATYTPALSGITIGSNVYDVRFAFGGFNALFDADGDRIFGEGDSSAFAHAPMFWGDQAGALAAATAIMGALGNDAYIGEYFGSLYDSFRVPYAVHPAAATQIFYYEDEFSALNQDAVQAIFFSETHWSGLHATAIFTRVSGVPLPAALWLFAPAIGMLGLRPIASRRRTLVAKSA